MSGSDSTILKFFSGLFKNHNNGKANNSNEPAAPPWVTLKIVKYAMQILAIVLTGELINQSRLWPHISSTTQYLLQALLTTPTIVPSSVPLVLLFVLFFVYLPEIARTLAPIFALFRSYSPPLLAPGINQRKRTQLVERPKQKTQHTEDHSQAPDLDQLKKKVQRIVADTLKKIVVDPPYGDDMTAANENNPLQTPGKEKAERLCLDAIQQALTSILDSQHDQRKLEEIIKSVVAALRSGQKQTNQQKVNAITPTDELPTKTQMTTTPPPHDPSPKAVNEINTVSDNAFAAM